MQKKQNRAKKKRKESEKKRILDSNRFGAFSAASTVGSTFFNEKARVGASKSEKNRYFKKKRSRGRGRGKRKKKEIQKQNQKKERDVKITIEELEKKFQEEQKMKEEEEAKKEEEEWNKTKKQQLFGESKIPSIPEGKKSKKCKYHCDICNAVHYGIRNDIDIDLCKSIENGVKISFRDHNKGYEILKNALNRINNWDTIHRRFICFENIARCCKSIGESIIDESGKKRYFEEGYKYIEKIIKRKYIDKLRQKSKKVEIFELSIFFISNLYKISFLDESKKERLMKDADEILDKWENVDPNNEEISKKRKDLEFQKKMSESKTYYSILGVDFSANKKQIKKKYKRLAMKSHPDLVQDKSDEKAIEEATTKMQEINHAAGILLDDEKRKQYDERLLSKRKGESGFSFSEEEEWEDEMDEEELFTRIFGNRRRQRERRGGPTFGDFLEFMVFQEMMDSQNMGFGFF